MKNTLLNENKYNTIAHYSTVYLSITQTWVYSQILFLQHFRPMVITKRTENLDLFPLDRVFALYDGRSYPARCYIELMKKAFGYYPYFQRMLRREKAALLHSHFGYSGYEMLGLKRKLDIPMVTTFYGADLSLLPRQEPIWKSRYRELFAAGDMFLAEGSHMRECLIKLGCPEEKVFVQHLGIDPDRFTYAPRSLGKDGTVRILVAGSFREKKGIPYALEAFARVREKHNNIELTLIGESMGTAREVSEKRKIMHVIDRYGIGNCVRLLGYQPHSVFLEEVQKHHIFLSPSVHSEDGDTEGGAPVSITEASASGMPILSTTHCDIPEVVIDGTSGFLVPERDIDGLTERLEHLVTHHDVWKKMGKAGREHIEEHYRITTQVKKLEEFYKRLVA